MVPYIPQIDWKAALYFLSMYTHTHYLSLSFSLTYTHTHTRTRTRIQQKLCTEDIKRTTVPFYDPMGR